MPKSTHETRRRFLQKTTASAFAAGIAAATRPAYARILGANERIHVGFIGVGGQGSSHLREYYEKRDEWNVRVAAISDVLKMRKERAKTVTGETADIYHDYRELLAREDIDAVVIATPDHWHMPMAVDALQAGKHVYLEKPMTRSFQDAKKLHEVWKECGMLLQVGTQHTSEDQYWRAREAIAEGLIGHVIWSQASYSRNSRGGEWQYTIHDADPTDPEQLDFERFLGSAPKRRFTKEEKLDRFFRWRKYWDYSGGIATDLFYHKLAPHHVAIADAFPIRAVSSGGIYQHPNRDVPDTQFIILDYPNDYSIVLSSSMAQSQGVPDMIRGHEATLTFHGGKIRIAPEQIYLDDFKYKHEGKEVIEIPTQPSSGHRENFLNSVRGREELRCPCDRGYKVMTAIAMGIDAYREQKAIGFDAERERYASPPDRPSFGELSRHML